MNTASKPQVPNQAIDYLGFPTSTSCSSVARHSGQCLLNICFYFVFPRKSLICCGCIGGHMAKGIFCSSLYQNHRSGLSVLGYEQQAMVGYNIAQRQSCRAFDLTCIMPFTSFYHTRIQTHMHIGTNARLRISSKGRCFLQSS